MSQKNTDHTVRRIVLPSGRSIEVVRFHDTPTAPLPLHVCPSCQSPLVQPLSWQECEGEQWELELECPNCQWHETGRHSREQVEQLEDRLDEGLATLLADLQRVTQANMSDEVELFSRALAADVILPEDF